MAQPIARPAPDPGGHGLPLNYWRGCRCQPCKAANADYQRWRQGGTLAAYLIPHSARWKRPEPKP